MTVVRVPGLNIVKSKGHTYYYHRKSGRRITAAPGTPQFLAQVQDAERSVKNAPKAVPGTLGRVIDAYRASHFFTDLRPATKKSYERAFEVMFPIFDRPITDFTSPFVAKLRDRVKETRGEWMANYILTVLPIVFDFAKERGWMTDNPARTVKKLRKSKTAAKANRPWTPDECRVAYLAAPPYLRVAIALAMCAGLRKRDVLTITRDAIKDGTKLEVETSKRGHMVRVPLHPALKSALASGLHPSAENLAVNSKGEPWTESGFNATFCKFIDRLEDDGKVGKGLTFHGLRHTAGTRMKEAGADDRTIADLLGQASLAMAHHYSKSADTTKRDTKVITEMNIFGEEQEQNLQNLLQNRS